MTRSTFFKEKTRNQLRQMGLILRISFVLAVFTACSTLSRKPTSDESSEKPFYPVIFYKTREVLKRDQALGVDAKLLKNTAETEVVAVLQKNPSLLSLERGELLKSIHQESLDKPNPTKHLRLVPPDGQSGYKNLKLAVSHPYYVDGTLIPPSDLVAFWADFLKQAEKEIILNVFDFDLDEIADLLIAKAKAGIYVRVGIDKNTIKTRPEVKKIADKLVAGGVLLTEVNSVSLNHQKVAAIDWSYPDKAKVLFSSGNLTQSCLGKEGDLKSLGLAKNPPESIPNANHVITMDSWIIASVVSHELTKTLDPSFLYRGSKYPLTGSYQVTGPGVDPNVLEAYPESSLILTFSPGGAFRNINRNIIAHFIRNSVGPVRMVQFAYSSTEVSDALLEKANEEYSKRGKFDFLSVGDTPFAMQFWSQFLKMSGLEQKMTSGRMRYEEAPENPWLKTLSESQMTDLRKNIRTAPKVFGNHVLRIDGKSHRVSAKIHHKILVTGPYAIVGTSFNFSQGAEANNEQILVFKDEYLVKAATGMAQWLAENSPRSVYEEAERRNGFSGPVIDDEGSIEDREARP